MMNGFSLEELSELLAEYDNLCHIYVGNNNVGLSFKDFVILRTGIGLEKEIKEFKVKQRIDDIKGDFENEQD